MANAPPLQREEILDATEAVLRRHGPTKTTVLDVSRALGVSHGSIYRHFTTKAELVAAVTERWLAQVITPLAVIVDGRGRALLRMRKWFDQLTATKRQLAAEDPELFDTYVTLMDEAPEMVTRHVDALLDQLTAIVESGLRTSDIETKDSARTARAVFHAMSRFHHPRHRHYWTDPDLQEHYDAVWELVMTGLEPRRR